MMDGPLHVAITGANGFIGGRLVECLHLGGLATVKALVRGSSNTARIQRLPVSVEVVDLQSSDSLVPALKGCDALVHCAFDFRVSPDRSVPENIAATEAVLAAAREAGIGRLIHLSSMVVYGYPNNEIVTEESPRSPLDAPYEKAKAAIEEMVLQEAARGELSCVVLQPTIVYGPYSGAWTMEPLRRIAAGQMMLYDDGLGVCNSLYVDNLVQAIVCCLNAGPEVDGECFIISDGEPTTWGEFLGHYARWIGVECPSIDAAEQRRLDRAGGAYGAASRLLRGIARAPGLQWLKRVRSAVTVGVGVLQKEAAHNWIKAQEPVMKCRNIFAIQKARRLLHYTPSVTLQDGMRRTEEWARWSRLVP